MPHKISRRDLINLFKELGFPDASRWDNERITVQVRRLAENTTEWTDLDINDELLWKILETIIRTEGAIMVSDETRFDDAEDPKDDLTAGFYDSASAESNAEPEPEPIAVNSALEELLEPKQDLDILEEFDQTLEPEVDEPEVPPLIGVRHTKGRMYQAGKLLAEVGVERGITDAMIRMIEDRSPKKNERESRYALSSAWHVIDGFLNGGKE